MRDIRAVEAVVAQSQTRDALVTTSAVIRRTFVGTFAVTLEKLVSMMPVVRLLQHAAMPFAKSEPKRASIGRAVLMRKFVTMPVAPWAIIVSLESVAAQVLPYAAPIVAQLLKHASTINA